MYTSFLRYIMPPMEPEIPHDEYGDEHHEDRKDATVSQSPKTSNTTKSNQQNSGPAPFSSLMNGQFPDPPIAMLDQASTQSSGADSSDVPPDKDGSRTILLNSGSNHTRSRNNRRRRDGQDDNGGNNNNGAFNSNSGIVTESTSCSATTPEAFEVSSSGSVAIGGSAMQKDEADIGSSSALTDMAPQRPDLSNLIRHESSRKTVRILEPSTGSLGRLSDKSLDIEDTEDFVIDTAHMDGDSSGLIGETTGTGNTPQHSTTALSAADGLSDSMAIAKDPGGDGGNQESGSMAFRFMREITQDPSRNGNDEKYPNRSFVWKVRLICGKIVENPTVQLGIIFLIIVNAIFMGIATFDFVTDNDDVDQGFDSLDRAFLVVFTIELVLQLVYRSFSYFTDSWLVFDFVIVVISWSLESLQIVRAFRIFRAFRLVTRIGPLRELVIAIGAVMPRMYAIAMLLLLIFYIFGVLFTELFRELETEANYFGSLDRSLFTCMELMSLEWSGVARDVMEEKSWAWAPIVAFIQITGFIVFNLIVAVVCDAVAVVDREVQAERLGEFETDTSKLEKAQERIWDMTDHIEQMLEQQSQLENLLLKLNGEMEDLTGKKTGIVPSHRPSLRRQSSVVQLSMEQIRSLQETADD